MCFKLFDVFSSKKNRSLRNPLTLRKNFTWTFLGNGIFSATQWGILIVLAKLGNPEMVGKYALALAITTPIILLSSLQLRAIQVTDTIDLYNFGDYAGLRIISSFFAILVTIIIVILNDYPIDTILIIFIILTTKVVDSFSDVMYGVMQKSEHMDSVSKSKILKGVMSLFLLIILLWTTKNIVMSTLALPIVSLVILFLYDKKLAENYTSIRPVYDWRKMRRLIILSLPLGLVLMMGSLNTNIPRYFLEYYSNEIFLGYFAAITYLIVVGSTIMNALGQSASPRLARYYALGEVKKFKNLILKMNLIGIIIGSIGIGLAAIYGKEILAIIYDENYSQYSKAFVLVMVSGAVSYIGSFIGFGITAARAFKVQPVIGSIWVTVSIIGSYLIIPKYGVIGASYLLIISSIVQLITKQIVLTYLLEKKVGQGKDV